MKKTGCKNIGSAREVANLRAFAPFKGAIIPFFFSKHWLPKQNPSADYPSTLKMKNALNKAVKMRREGDRRNRILEDKGVSRQEEE
jgi:hypothetical protein